ncbi:heavy metal translocating P-type ATPase [Aquibacillus kalidii]|uniref:heavy metal translocating P-type ATPase n=1 Tax=Aquibacillus kalidii TaxID=2762597 RepID=UPI002E29F658|nr:heavy metal translocating P-type ATPase [Aquibacillus kalidii]
MSSYWHSIYNNFNLFFKKHGELVAALISGILILSAWTFENRLPEHSHVMMLLSAFIIGGFAKAKEGFEETIKERELNVEMLMIFAAIGSALIGYWTEGAILIFIFALSGALETYTMNKSEKEISSLMDLQPEEALRINKYGEEKVSVKKLQLGDRILIKAGERVPADGVIMKGSTSIDESTLTGEAIPVTKQIESEVLAGTVNLNGSIVVEITKFASDSLFQKIIDLVHSAQSEKSPSQLFIEKFETTYVKVVLIAVALMMFLPHFMFGWSWTDTIYRAMILLVVASPCALVASIMPATLSAISTGARNGVLFKGGVHIENLATIDAIAFDKTGTLTNGTPTVTDIHIDPSINDHDFLSIVSSIEKESNHPLAQAIVRASQERSISFHYELQEMKDTAGCGVTAQINNEQWKIGNAKLVGKESANHFANGIANKLAQEAKTLVYVAKNNQVVGLFALKDELRTDTVQAIKALNKLGIHTVMLTGDNEMTAKAIAKEANIKQYIANCLPEDKVNQIKELNKSYRKVAMIGDGINDAPALATASLGIAMGTGTDVALETADVVLMKNKLSKITNAISLSKRMNTVIKQNAVFSITVIFVLIAANFAQFLDLPLGVIGHEGSTILVILNGLRLLKA